MNLNNNWKQNVDTGKWISSKDSLKKSDFDSLMQDFKSYRFYQKCLSGSTYVGVNSPIIGTRQNCDINDVYDILTSGYTQSTYFFGYQPVPNALTFSEIYSGPIPNNSSRIDSIEDLNTWSNKILPDYNFTLKNLFTPERLIKDQKSNIYYIDLATTESIPNLTSKLPGLTLDGIIVKEGHKILVKDQFILVTISSSINPDIFFNGYYEVNNIVGTNTTYRIPTSDNGIYTFTNGSLVRSKDLDDYNSLVRYSICAKLGNSNREKQFKLRRLNSGLFPEYYSGTLYPGGPSGESIKFEETHNWVLRQRVDYNNLFELSLQDTLKHATQSLVVTITNNGISSTQSYIIPERTITVGEFGSIINHQESISNFIDCKVKKTFRSIDETTRYYWICGDEGTLLRVDKIDFSIKEIQLRYPNTSDRPSDRVLTNLTSISFFNDLRGVIVGKFNQVWVTSDSGENWKQIYLADFDGFSYNSVVFKSIDSFYVGGDNGVFIEFSFSLGEWFATKRRISKFIDGLEDEFILVNDIKSLLFFQKNNSNYLLIGCELNTIYLYDIDNSISSDWDFIYLQDTLNTNNNFGDISSITWVNNNAYFSTFGNIYQIDPVDGFFSVGTNSNVFSTTFSNFLTQSGINSIISYQNQLIYTGNFSLWKFNNLTPTQFDVYDAQFFERLKPRLLFMDYDIGSKLYWFDDFNQYRIPERYGITVSYLQDLGTNSYIGFNQNLNSVFDVNTISFVTYSETNWITYFKDRQKTFEFYSDTHISDFTKVEPSFTFSSSDDIGRTFSYGSASVTNQYSDILGLMPIAVPPGSEASLTQSSRFRDLIGVPITLPTTPFNLYFYDYLGIWNVESSLNDVGPSVGDVISIDSDVFDGKFIINKIITTQSSIGGNPAQMLFSVQRTNGERVVQVEYPLGNPITSTFSLPSASTTFQLPVILQEISLINQIVVAQITASSSGFTSFYNPQQFTINIESPIGSSFNGTSIFLNVLSGPTGFENYLTPFSGGQDPTLTNNHFCYFYTDFNQNILNNIPLTQIGFEVRNLNKYPQTPNGLTSSQYFVDNFNQHYIGYSYDCEITNVLGTFSFEITPKYSQWSAYYNLQSKIDVQDVNSNIYSDEIKYTTGFLNFGYSPTYNLLSYLNFISPSEFSPGKEFLSMPNYIDVPGPQLVPNDIENQIFIDISVETNKLKFGENLKYIWDSFLKWTFVDVIVTHVGGLTVSSERLLIYDKFVTPAIGTNTNWYVIEFHDEIQFTLGLDIEYVTLLSRRSLQQISDDLQYINRLHRPNNLISESRDITSLTVLGTYSNYESDINFKISTDSYTKILLSDETVIKNLTGILYTDYKYELSMQMTKLDRTFEKNVSISNNSGQIQLNLTQPHELNNNDYVIIELIGTQSTWNPEILGYHNITVTNTDSFTIPVTYSTTIPPSGSFKIKYVKKDYFLNYQPIDLFDLGVGDKLIKQSVEIETKNWKVVNDSYDLKNLNLDKYKFRLIDGLDLVALNAQYPWILEAEISDAIIGRGKTGELIWYKGIWYCGRWFGGTWISGSWLSGDFYEGVWTSKKITDGLIEVKVDDLSTNFRSSVWYDGRWFGGTWENGTWYNGRWYGGNWKNGRWFDGIWNDGTWDNGEFQSGIWVRGQWNNGIFNQKNGSSFWLDGKFYGGDFENGIWYNGVFDQKSGVKSRFGTKSNNSRLSIWRSGKFLNGEFHSFLNQSNGDNLVSDVHKYSIWKTGVFLGGDFWGGLVYNINFKNTIWHGGISEDIKVLSISPTDNQIVLEGDYPFNVNDEIYLVDNKLLEPLSDFGSTDNPRKYRVLRAKYDNLTDTTTINTDINLSGISVSSGLASNIRCVSNFKNSIWNTGLWYNGVFDGGVFNGGIFYNGYFEGTWG